MKFILKVAGVLTITTLAGLLIALIVIKVFGL